MWRGEGGERKKGEELQGGRGGAPAFQVTLDPGLLWPPSARLSGGFVRASQLNGHPADRHAVYPLCVCYARERERGRERLPSVFVCVCQRVSGERQEDES